MASEDSRYRGIQWVLVDDPLCETWPFLLIVRTGRIVTSHAANAIERV